MANFEGFKQNANDWKVTSYGDVGGFAGYGGKITHFRFYSPTLKKGLSTVLLEAGLGASIEIEFSFLSSLDSFLQGVFKAKEAATANSNYKQLNCFRAFSMWDIIGAKAGSADASISSIFGLKTSGIWVSSGGAILFEVPLEVSGSFGVGGGFSFTSGVFVAFGSEISNVYQMERFQRELRRKPTDQVPRPAGGYAN